MKNLKFFLIGIAINAISWVYIIEKGGSNIHISFFLILPLVFGLSMFLLKFFLERIERLDNRNFLITKTSFMDKFIGFIVAVMGILIAYIFGFSDIKYPLPVKVLLIGAIISLFTISQFSNKERTAE